MGQPAAGNAAASAAESIGGGGQTRGSEISQYPEEQKATAIPSVATSEAGGAQTGCPGERVCVGHPGLGACAGPRYTAVEE